MKTVTCKYTLVETQFEVSADLKNCPFCDGPPEIISDYGWLSIRCRNQCTTNADGEEELEEKVENWNTRNE